MLVPVCAKRHGRKLHDVDEGPNLPPPAVEVGRVEGMTRSRALEVVFLSTGEIKSIVTGQKNKGWCRARLVIAEGVVQGDQALHDRLGKPSRQSPFAGRAKLESGVEFMVSQLHRVQPFIL